MLSEFYRTAFRKKISRSLAELQTDLDAWLRESNVQRPHQRRWCYGKTPMQAFLDTVPLAKEKEVVARTARTGHLSLADTERMSGEHRGHRNPSGQRDAARYARRASEPRLEFQQIVRESASMRCSLGSAFAMKVLFISYHSLTDPSSGAARSVSEILAMLVQHGWDCRALSGPAVDRGGRRELEASIGDAERVFDMKDSVPFYFAGTYSNGVPVTHYVPIGTFTPNVDPSPAHTAPFLEALRYELQTFQPDLVITYGGMRVGLDIVAACKDHGAAVVFYLASNNYTSSATLEKVDAVCVPSEFMAEHYRKLFGLSSTPLPRPIYWDGVRAPEGERKYVTFVSPINEKGIAVVARMLCELGRQRPDIPFLIVEGRGRPENLCAGGLDLRHVRSAFVMRTTTDPRDFYGITRVVLFPSLREPGARVTIEALINGLPILASRRGGTPEQLHEAGTLLDVPERFQVGTPGALTAEEARPWIDALLRLWDDPVHYEAERKRSFAAAQAFSPAAALDAYVAFFEKAHAKASRTHKTGPLGEASLPASTKEVLDRPSRREVRFVAPPRTPVIGRIEFKT